MQMNAPPPKKRPADPVLLAQYVSEKVRGCACLAMVGAGALRSVSLRTAWQRALSRIVVQAKERRSQ